MTAPQAEELRLAAAGNAGGDGDGGPSLEEDEGSSYQPSLNGETSGLPPPKSDENVLPERKSGSSAHLDRGGSGGEESGFESSHSSSVAATPYADERGVERELSGVEGRDWKDDEELTEAAVAGSGDLDEGREEDDDESLSSSSTHPRSPLPSSPPPSSDLGGDTHIKDPDHPPLRVLFLSSDTGGGHRASAESLAAQFQRLFPGTTYRLLDVVAECGVPPYNSLVGWYSHLSKNPAQWNLVYKVSNTRAFQAVADVQLRVMTERAIRRKIAQSFVGEGAPSPDVVVSVHPLMNAVPAAACLNLSHESGRHVPFFTVVTDLGSAHAMWFDRNVEKMFLASEQLRTLAMERGGVEEEKIVMTGLPIRRDFAVQAESMGVEGRDGEVGRIYRKRVRDGLGLFPGSHLSGGSSLCPSSGRHKDHRVVLVMGGGEGCGALGPIVDALYVELVRRDLESTVVVVCGRNEALRQNLAERDWHAVLERAAEDTREEEEGLGRRAVIAKRLRRIMSTPGRMESDPRIVAMLEEEERRAEEEEAGGGNGAAEGGDKVGAAGDGSNDEEEEKDDTTSPSQRKGAYSWGLRQYLSSPPKDDESGDGGGEAAATTPTGSGAGDDAQGKEEDKKEVRSWRLRQYVSSPPKDTEGDGGDGGGEAKTTEGADDAEQKEEDRRGIQSWGLRQYIASSPKTGRNKGGDGANAGGGEPPLTPNAPQDAQEDEAKGESSARRGSAATEEWENSPAAAAVASPTAQQQQEEWIGYRAAAAKRLRRALGYPGSSKRKVTTDEGEGGSGSSTPVLAAAAEVGKDEAEEGEEVLEDTEVTADDADGGAETAAAEDDQVEAEQNAILEAEQDAIQTGVDAVESPSVDAGNGDAIDGEQVEGAGTNQDIEGASDEASSGEMATAETKAAAEQSEGTGIQGVGDAPDDGAGTPRPEGEGGEPCHPDDDEQGAVDAPSEGRTEGAKAEASVSQEESAGEGVANADANADADADADDGTAPPRTPARSAPPSAGKPQFRLDNNRRGSTSSAHVTVVPLGFVTRMAEYMVAADVLISKAGPGTIAEAASVGLPVLLTSFLPGQEEGNVDFVTERGFGAYVPDTDPRGVATEAATWLGDSKILSELGGKAREAGCPNAAEDIARQIGKSAARWKELNEENATHAYAQATQVLGSGSDGAVGEKKEEVVGEGGEGGEADEGENKDKAEKKEDEEKVESASAPASAGPAPGKVRYLRDVIRLRNKGAAMEAEPSVATDVSLTSVGL